MTGHVSYNWRNMAEIPGRRTMRLFFLAELKTRISAGGIRTGSLLCQGGSAGFSSAVCFVLLC